MLWLCILLPRSERTALETLALWALQWSSQVSYRLPGDDAAAPDAVDEAMDEAMLWLEIGASRQLLGEPVAVRGRIAEALTALGYRHRLGIAPTPQGAALLARAGFAAAALTRGQLEQQLAPLPLTLLAMSPAQRAALHSAGLQTIGEVLALPDAAVGRRLGPAASRYLQRLRGAAREPLRMVRAPEQFSVRCEFPDAITDTTALLFPLQRLLAGLQGYLRARDRAVQRYTLRLEHHQRSATQLTIGLARPGRDAAQLLALARERLAATVLAAPVHGLGLETRELLPPLVLQDDLFSRAAQQAEQLQQVIDRLGARLGAAAVRTLSGAADHRPERAWRNSRAGTVAPAATGAPAQPPQLPPRPCWLLTEPRRIDPPQQLLAGPERIESGWWDGADVARDYYLARDTDGAQLWVFHDLRSGIWCVHGLWA